MLSAYVFALCFGSVLIAAGAFSGGSDSDHGGDHQGDADHGGHLADAHGADDLDHDHGADAHDATHDAVHAQAIERGSAGGPWLPFLSLRFWTFGAASFGATGALLTAFGVPEPFPAALSFVDGLLIGTLAAWVFRQLPRDRVSGATTFDRFAGLEARVLIPIPEDALGKIRVETAAGFVDLPARTGDHRGLTLGQRVLIASVSGGVADVTGLSSPSSEARHRAQTERPIS